MSFGEDGEYGRNLANPFLHTGSWYRLGSRQSSMMGSSTVIRESSISAMVITFSLGIGPIPWVIMSEILPINIKGLAGSIVTLCNVFSFVITMTANYPLDWSSGGTFTIYMLIAAFTVAFVVIWVPETKGRALGRNTNVIQVTHP